MKFASIGSQRLEAQPGLTAKCPSCAADVIAKCGNVRDWHWAHRGARVCDPWWESETAWHRRWKNEFPSDWQEIIHIAPSGEKHVADVKTKGDMVVEFQHSFLNAEERISREGFYRRMVWVVDGSRRKRDAAQLLKCIGPLAWNNPPYILHRTNDSECALLRDWHSSTVPVYFDLGIGENDRTPILWRLDPISQIGGMYLTPVSRESFLKTHR
jgi:competence protein CoiA